MDISMTERNIVLVAHVLAAIMFLGPVTVATSLFPRYAGLGQWQVARAFHRISRGYGMASLAVPAFGLLLAARIGYLGQLWVNLSLALFVVGFFLMVGYIVPAQARVLASESSEGVDRSGIAKLRVATGSSGMIWLVVLYLMVAKPS